jgi:hypothetical protein
MKMLLDTNRVETNIMFSPWSIACPSCQLILKEYGEADTESEADTDSESEADTDSESEADTDSESEADTDSESEADTDSELDS